MRNEGLAQAIRRSGLTLPQVAEQVGVDAKTVERWVRKGIRPYPVHRQKVVAVLQVAERELWALPDPLARESERDALVETLRGDVAELTAQLTEARGEVAIAESVVWRLVGVRAIPITGRHLTFRNEIGEVPEKDLTIETRMMESADPPHRINWWLMTIGASHPTSQIPAKSSIRQLERLEAWEVVGDEHSLPSQVLSLGRRDGYLWALILLDSGRSSLNGRLLYSWAGIWNPLRLTGRDRSVLDLRPNWWGTHSLEWEAITVEFQFPRTARRPDVWSHPGTPDLSPEVTTDPDGRTTFTIHINHPEQLHYAWELEVQGFDPA